MLMANIERDGDRIIVDVPFRFKDLVKAVPGSSWSTADSRWTVPLTWASCKQLRGVFGDGLNIGPALVEWSAKEYTTRVEPCMTMRVATDAEGDENLFSFQRVGNQFLKVAGSALLGDEMGTGKTVQMATVLRDEKLMPALVVCPNSVKYNWMREIEKWAPELRPVVVEGSATQRRKQIALARDGEADVVIINWEALKSHTKLSGYGSVRVTPAQAERKELDEIKWAVVIADEAHKAKNPKAQQTRALWNLGTLATRRYALTGTPIAKNVGDLWSIMHFVAPDEWPTRSKFLDRYALTSFNPFGGMDIVGVKPQTQQEFYEILDPRFLRRPKAAVLKELPDKVYTVREIEWTTKQEKTYRALAKDMIARIDDGVLLPKNALEESLRLIQLSSAMLEPTDDGGYTMTMPSNKIDAMLDLIEERDEPLVFFAEHRQLLELASAALEKKSIPHVTVSGGQSPQERQQAIDDFQSGRVNVILLTAAAGGEGITLTASSTLVFLQRPWSMILNKQAEDRIHRIGQAAEHIEIITLVTKDSIEWHRMNVLEGREISLQEVVRDAELLRSMI